MVESYATDELWVATEKVHGTNFSFVYDGEKLRHAKRTSYLEDKDSFYNFQEMSKRHADKIKAIFTHLRADIPTLKVIKVFGEYYGGIYPDQKGKSKAIQRTIFYSPEVDFEAFDLFYETTDDETQKILNYKQACQLFEKVGLPFAHIQAEGTLKELLKSLNPEAFESTIYLKHGMPKVEGNFAEGYVIKPVDAIFTDGGRLSIKVKNSKHLESLPALKQPVQKAPQKKEQAQLSEEEQAIVDIALGYVTEQRFQNVISKMTEDERTEKNVSSFLLQDAWKDFTKGEEKAVVDKANKLKGKIMPLLKESAVKLFTEQN